jgi:hypothetical protein
MNTPEEGERKRNFLDKRRMQLYTNWPQGHPEDGVSERGSHTFSLNIPFNMNTF